MVKFIYKTRYVIQRHSRPDDLHWDLMIEQHNVLKTWRINTSPEKITNTPLSAESIFDHDIKFLTYTGPVNKGTASVQIADSGICHIEIFTDEQIQGRFEGSVLSTDFTLLKTTANQWELTCR